MYFRNSAKQKMEVSPEDGISLSRKLCKVLDYVGLSETMRNVWMEYGLVTEAFLGLRTKLMNRPLDMFKFGSGIEGSTIPGLHSDLDILLLHNIPVVERLKEAPENGMCYLIVCDLDTPAGFVKLQVVQDGVKLVKADRSKDHPEEHYAVDKMGRLVRNNNTSLQDRLNKATRSGPAHTCEDKNFGSVDYVEAYHCSTWPEVASDWLRAQCSKNQYGENAGFLAEMEAHGCFFVGIGHPNSEETDLEWRISLSSQERALMFKMTQNQFKCYVILKVLKEEFIKPNTGKSLSSYHCKTALLHVIEREESSVWTEERLVEAVFRCLRLLLEWVQQGSCPNYFVRKENMFRGKIHGDIQKKVETVLDDLIERGNDVFLDLKCDGIGELLRGDIEHIKDGEMSMAAWENLYRIHLDTVCEFCQSIDRIKGLYAGDPDPDKCKEGISNVLNELTSMKSLGLHDKTGIANGVQYFIPSAKVCFGTNLIACALRQDGNARQSLIEQGMAYLEESTDALFLSGRLKYASCMFALGQVGKCLDILTDLENKLDSSSASTCACRHIEYAINQHLVQKLVQENASTRQLAKTTICMCVSFQRSEMEITPFPLRYEMFRCVGAPENSVGGFGVYWYTSACVDSKVFLYFLKYLVQSSQNDVSLKRECVVKMLQIVDDDPALNHKETAYNLLAWICKQEGYMSEAAKYCMKSWQYLVDIEEKCTSSVHPHHNAVKWHVISLINECHKSHQ